MHFIFGICREVPVKIERKTSKLALIGLAILIVALFIVLTFEDLDEEIRATDLIFNPASISAQMAGADNAVETDCQILPEQNSRRSELKN
jgi:hypothetical protein